MVFQTGIPKQLQRRLSEGAFADNDQTGSFTRARTGMNKMNEGANECHLILYRLHAAHGADNEAIGFQPAFGTGKLALTPARFELFRINSVIDLSYPFPFRPHSAEQPALQILTNRDITADKRPKR